MDRLTEKVDKFGMPLEEMANAIKKYTGINGVVYFSTKEEIGNQQAHSLGRIKLLRDGEKVFVTIKPGADGKRKIGGNNEKMIKDLLRFVEANEDILWAYWNTPKDEADSASTMSEFVTV